MNSYDVPRKMNYLLLVISYKFEKDFACVYAGGWGVGDDWMRLNPLIYMLSQL